jgi:signal transduction histidine kinase
MTDSAQPQRSVARWQRALLPGGLYEPSSGRRSIRDWSVDLTMFGFAVVTGLLIFKDAARGRSDLTNATDLVVGSAVCIALWLRRTRPLAVALFAIAASAPFAMAGGAGLVAIFNAAIRVPRRSLVVVAGMSLAGSAVFPLVNPHAASFLVQLAVGALLTAVAIGWGLFVRVRRELIVSLRDRAERVESEQRRHVEQARDAERRRIAYEMHDVLAHRLSLLSLHAGALEFRPDAPAEEVADAAGVIRATAATALNELRDVIGVLREGSGDSTQPPQPTLADLPDLLDESRATGMTVRAQIDSSVVDSIPDALARTAYRVVQEALTNARKHAPSAAVDVRIAGEGGAGLAVEIVSRRAVDVGAAKALTSAGGGSGLIGLTERLALVGGELEHGPDANGDFVVRATFPPAT